jgi:hypothetical protein
MSEETTPSPKPSLPFKLSLGGLLKSMISDKAMQQEVTKMLTGIFDGLAPKMKDSECLFAVPNTEKNKLRIFKGTFLINEDKTVTITTTGVFDIANLAAQIDPSKLTPEQQQKLQDSFNH